MDKSTVAQTASEWRLPDGPDDKAERERNRLEAGGMESAEEREEKGVCALCRTGEEGG